MEEFVEIESLWFPTDHRGLVLEPIGPEALPLQRNVHIALTGPGHVRGNLYHRHGTKVAVILGPALFRYREGGQIKDHVIGEGLASRVTIPAGVAHAYKNTGTTPMLIVAFHTAAHDPEDPGVVREVLIEP